MKTIKKLINAFWSNVELLNSLYPGYIQMSDFSYYPAVQVYPYQKGYEYES